METDKVGGVMINMKFVVTWFVEAHMTKLMFCLGMMELILIKFG